MAQRLKEMINPKGVQVTSVPSNGYRSLPVNRRILASQDRVIKKLDRQVHEDAKLEVQHILTDPLNDRYRSSFAPKAARL